MTSGQSVSDYGCFTRRTRGCVNSHYIRMRSGKKTEGIGVTKVVLRGIRKLGYILYSLDIRGLTACGVHSLAVKFYVAVNVLHELYEPFTLKGCHFLSGHTFYFFIPDHFLRSSELRLVAALESLRVDFYCFLRNGCS